MLQMPRIQIKSSLLTKPHAYPEKVSLPSQASSNAFTFRDDQMLQLPCEKEGETISKAKELGQKTLNKRPQTSLR